MNAVAQIGYNNLYNANSFGIGFGKREKPEHSEKVQKIMDDFYSTEPKGINDGSSTRLKDCAVPIGVLLNLLALALCIPNENISGASLALIVLSILFGLNGDREEEVINAARQLSDELAKNGISQEEMYEALKEIAKNNRQLPFCCVGDEKINAIIAESLKNLKSLKCPEDSENKNLDIEG